MDPMTMYAVGAGVSALGGILGNVLSSGDRRRAMEAYDRALDEIKGMRAPPDLARTILLREFEQVGVLTPELEDVVNLASSSVEQIKEAPELRKAQITALQLLGERARAGFSAEDRASLAQIGLQLARDTEAKRQQILQSYQQRGLGGAGSELIAQLQGASAGSAQAGEEGIKLQSEAARAARESAAELGRLGGQVRGQEFDISRTKAEAEDRNALTRFNEAVARQQRDVATRMDVQRQNLAERQRIADLDTADKNAESRRQRDAEAQMHEFELRRVGLLSDAYRARAGGYLGQAQQTAGMLSGVGSAAGQALIAGGTYLAGKGSDKQLAGTLGRYPARQSGGYPAWQSGQGLGDYASQLRSTDPSYLDLLRRYGRPE